MAEIVAALTRRLEEAGCRPRQSRALPPRFPPFVDGFIVDREIRYCETNIIPVTRLCPNSGVQTIITIAKWLFYKII